MQPLYVYISASCLICQHTQQLVASLRELRPGYAIILIDLDQPESRKPPFVFGTPTYVLAGRIVSLGNPALQRLVQLLDRESASAVMHEL